jgi:tetratricopeptide (TPR) repeat protein
MASVWQCRWCKTENDPESQFRQTGPGVCENCGKSRHLLPILIATGVIVIVGIASVVVYAVTYPKQAYTGRFDEYYAADKRISPEEREQLDGIAKRFKLAPEQCTAWEKEIIAGYGGTPPLDDATAVSSSPGTTPPPTVEDPTIYIKQGMIYASQGNFEAAAKEFEAATRADGTSEEAWANLGAAKQQLRDYSGALEAYTKALSVEPGYWQAHINLATLYIRLRDNDKAIEEIRSALDAAEQPAIRAEVVKAIKAETELSPLRGDPRFKELVGRM